METKEPRNKSDAVGDARATEHKSTQIICGTHTGSHRLITNPRGRAGSNYFWFSCIQIFAERNPRHNKQTSSGVQGLDFALCCCTCPQKPSRNRDGTGTGTSDTCILGRQIRAAQPHGAGEVSVPSCHQQSPSKTLVGSLPRVSLLREG